MWDKFILGTREQTAKISKTGFANVSKFFSKCLQMFPLQFPSPNGLGSQVLKLTVTNLKVGKTFFCISLLGLFSPEPHLDSKSEYKVMIIKDVKLYLAKV